MQRHSHSPDPAAQPASVGDCGGSLLAIDGGLRRIIVLAPPGAVYAARRHRFYLSTGQCARRLLQRQASDQSSSSRLLK
jgi:hypothetical protein